MNAGVRIVLSLAPLVVSAAAFVFLIRALFVGSGIIVPLVMLCCCVLYVASGSWRRFSLVERVGDR